MATHPAPEGGVGRALSHPLVAGVARQLAIRRPIVVPPDATARRAAVALILQVREGATVELLMIKRATYEGDPWSGHVALPGGRQEPGDRSLEETAIRETREETAVDLARAGRILGRLDDLQPLARVTPRFVITPVVAVLGADMPIAPSSEVAEAFWVPVEALRDPAASREIVLELTGGPRRVPSFQHGDYTIWGLTERILRQFLALIGQT